MIKQNLAAFYRMLGYRFKPYKVKERELDGEGVTSLCAQVSESYQKLGLVNSFSLYRSVVDSLISDPKLDFKPLSDLMGPVKEGRVTVALRHDLDADIVTGLRAARFLASRGVPGSFYLLHTSHYYGMFDKGFFYRYSSLASFVDGFIATGCEIGLHADPLDIYCNHECNGIQAVSKELEWLRSCGAKIKGTVAHNSAAAYGAENFEVFRGMSVAGRTKLRYKNSSIPLGFVDENILGLCYEGNYPVLPDHIDSNEADEFIRLCKGDAVRNKEWLELYFLRNPFFDRSYDVDVWLLAKDAWVIAKRGEDRVLRWPVTTDDMLLAMGQLEEGVRVVVNIHPEYVSGKGGEQCLILKKEKEMMKTRGQKITRVSIMDPQ